MNTQQLIGELFEHQCPEKVLIRVDAGAVEGLSFGHVSRCMVLAEKLRQACSTDILFLMKEYKEGIEYVENRGFSVRTLPQHITAADHETLWARISKEVTPQWTIIDLPYEMPFSGINKKLKRLGSKTIFIDDVRFITPGGTDVLLNSSILAREKTKGKSIGTRYLLGPDYFIFDPPPPLSRGEKHGVPKVLITFGGSDPAGLTPKAVDAIQKADLAVPFDLAIIAGPGFAAAHPRALAQFRDSRYTLIESPPEIYPLFMASDLVICAGGRTLYELDRMGIPCLPVASIPHEREAIEAFIARGRVKQGCLVWDETRFLTAFNRELKRISRSL